MSQHEQVVVYAAEVGRFAAWDKGDAANEETCDANAAAHLQCHEWRLCSSHALFAGLIASFQAVTLDGWAYAAIRSSDRFGVRRLYLHLRPGIRRCL